MLIITGKLSSGKLQFIPLLFVSFIFSVFAVGFPLSATPKVTTETPSEPPANPYNQTFPLAIPRSSDPDTLKIQTGVRVYAMSRQEDDFSRGLQHFRPGLYPYTQFSAVNSEKMPYVGLQEFYIKALNGLADGHSIGIAVGNISIPSVKTKEFRYDKDLFIHGASSTESTFISNYLLFTYDYRIADFRFHRLFARSLRPFFQGWQLEVGGGFGIISPSQWKTRGWEYSASPYRNSYISEMNSDQTSSPGSIAELKIGLINNTYFSDHVTVQAGLSVKYAYTGGYSGSARSSQGLYYYDSAGHLISVSDSQILYMQNEKAALGNDYKDVYYPAVKQADIYHSMVGAYISFGATF
jgi:hypothetical protein